MKFTKHIFCLLSMHIHLLFKQKCKNVLVDNKELRMFYIVSMNRNE